MSRTAILRAIKNGKISAQKNEHGEWDIDPAELHRVYPPVADDAVIDNINGQHQDNTSLALENRGILAPDTLGKTRMP